jgi:hypothetical protein
VAAHGGDEVVEVADRAAGDGARVIRGPLGEQLTEEAHLGLVGVPGEVVEVGAAIHEERPDDVGNDGKVGTGPRLEPASRQPSRLGPPRVDDPQLSWWRRHLPQSHHGVGEPVEVPVAHDGVAPNERRERASPVVDDRHEIGLAGHEERDEGLAGVVDADRRVLRPRPDGPDESLGGPLAGSVQRRGRPDVRTDRVGPRRCEAPTHERPDIGQCVGPRH